MIYIKLHFSLDLRKEKCDESHRCEQEDPVVIYKQSGELSLRTEYHKTSHCTGLAHLPELATLPSDPETAGAEKKDTVAGGYRSQILPQLQKFIVIIRRTF